MWVLTLSYGNNHSFSTLPALAEWVQQNIPEHNWDLISIEYERVK